MRGWLGAVIMLCAVVSFASLADPAQAQITEAQVIQQCAARTALPAGGYTYKTAFVGFNDVVYEAQNAFPGRNNGDMHVEVIVTAAANFNCVPDLNGTNPQNLPSFTIPVTPRGMAYLGDLQACSMQGGSSKMIIAFPGATCPWLYKSGIPDIARFTGNGDYVTFFAAATNFPCTVYWPTPLGANGVRHPIIVWGNGAGFTVDDHDALFNYWASYGFVVIAANTTNASSGADMLTCLNALIADNGIPQSLFYRKLNTTQVAASGMNIGASGALMVARDPRIKATALFMPCTLSVNCGQYNTSAHTQQNGTMLLISGQNATIDPPATHQQPVFNSTNVPVAWITEKAGDAGLSITKARASLPFLRWQLMQHDLAAPYFVGANCTLCVDPAWTVQKKGIP